MAANNVTPLRPPCRVSETVRPASGARLKSARVSPLRPAPLPNLSVVERRASEHFPCAHKGCSADGVVLSQVPAAGTTLVVLFCVSCVEKLSCSGVRPVPVAKESR